MKITRCCGWLCLALLFLSGCPSSTVSQSDLSADAARQFLETFNPSYVKVIDFYGLYYPDQRSPRNTCTAYLSITNPSDKEQKMVIYEAHFKRLIKGNGQGHWYLTALLTHSSGLSRRLGWDNLMNQVK